MTTSDHPAARMASLDIDALRSHFPALTLSGTAFFDGPGGTQTPDVVADAVRATMVAPVSNRGHVTDAERAADSIVYEARCAVADLLVAEPDGVVFGRSTTQLTFDLARAVARSWRRGDEVVVTRLDHDANVQPWLVAAEATGAVVRWVDFDPVTSELPVNAVQEQLSDRTRLVAVTGASNLVGTRPPIAQIADVVHAAGALVYVDGVHLTAHECVDLSTFGADFYAFSPYKLMGPHCAAVVARPELLERFGPDKVRPSSNAVPERYELGTLPYELLAGVTAMVNFIASIADRVPDRRTRIVQAMTAISRHEHRLRHQVETGLHDLGIQVHSRAMERTPTLLATFDNAPPSAAWKFLANLNINAPAGTFYATTAAERLGLGAAGGLRIGLAPYTNDSDVDRLLNGLYQFINVG